MIRYTVTSNKTGEVLDFESQKEALDYAEKVNKRRMARITEISWPDKRVDFGEMKYEMLTDKPNRYGGHIPDQLRDVYRIRALRSFTPERGKPVKIGDLGGWIEDTDSLSHYGDCWVYGDAQVLDTAQVLDDAVICGEAIVKDDAVVKRNAIVKDYVVVHTGSVIRGNAVVGGAASVKDCTIKDNAHIINAKIREDVGGNAEIDCLIATNIVCVPNALQGKDITLYDQGIRFDGKTYDRVDEFRKYVDRNMLLSPSELTDLNRMLERYKH